MQVLQGPATQARQAPDVALRRNDCVLPLELGVASSNIDEVTCRSRCIQPSRQ